MQLIFLMLHSVITFPEFNEFPFHSRKIPIVFTILGAVDAPLVQLLLIDGARTVLSNLSHRFNEKFYNPICLVYFCEKFNQGLESGTELLRLSEVELGTDFIRLSEVESGTDFIRLSEVESGTDFIRLS